ncbi:uncharacterized protein LOC102800461, partial [Saccoglossus kowalevskii]|uniref:Uncharacterized protein LOC102800461 n=1 Tax=Saccoglossus kowalevskii TaxID=10224 RepID=A0ABM0M3P8_SACKO
MGQPHPWQHSKGLLRVNLLLRAIKRLQGQSRRIRLPFTADLIFLMYSTLKADVFDPFTDVLMQSVILLAFFGFLRCGEFTINSNRFDRSAHLCIEDISFEGDTQAFLRLKSSKTDPFRKGVLIKFFQNHRMCPVATILQYLSLRQAMVPKPTFGDPLFVSKDNRPLTRSTFLTYLHRILSVLGIDSSRYSGHSFRIGAATSAATAGIPDHMIKTLGRWNSDTYY